MAETNKISKVREYFMMWKAVFQLLVLKQKSDEEIVEEVIEEVMEDVEITFPSRGIDLEEVSARERFKWELKMLLQSRGLNVVMRNDSSPASLAFEVYIKLDQKRYTTYEIDDEDMTVYDVTNSEYRPLMQNLKKIEHEPKIWAIGLQCVYLKHPKVYEHYMKEIKKGLEEMNKEFSKEALQYTVTFFDIEPVLQPIEELNKRVRELGSHLGIKLPPLKEMI